MDISSEPLQVLIKVIAPNGLCQKLLATIRPLLGSIRSRAGCAGCHIYQDAETPDELTLFEEWEDEASFVEHVCSKDYGYILEWMELSVEKPEVMVCKKTEQDGIKLIKEIRRAL